MAKYLCRNCPRCNGYFGIGLREPSSNGDTTVELFTRGGLPTLVDCRLLQLLGCLRPLRHYANVAQEMALIELSANARHGFSRKQEDLIQLC